MMELSDLRHSLDCNLLLNYEGGLSNNNGDGNENIT